MTFWELFKAKESSNRPMTGLSRLHDKIAGLLPGVDNEDEHIKVACLAGLLARIIHIDFKVHANEIASMKTALTEWSNLNNDCIEAIVKLALDEIKELSGRENHLYCYPLNNIMQNDEKYSLLESLFAIAAADGQVEHAESEEIRTIATGLHLSHHHFISARATVLTKLQALKKN